jgi:hypothetical protein
MATLLHSRLTRPDAEAHRVSARTRKGLSKVYFQDIEEWAAFGTVADALVAHLADLGFVTSPSDLEDLYRDWRLVRGHPAEWYLKRADAREVLANDIPPGTPAERSIRDHTAFDAGLSGPEVHSAERD